MSASPPPQAPFTHAEDWHCSPVVHAAPGASSGVHVEAAASQVDVAWQPVGAAGARSAVGAGARRTAPRSR